MSYDASTEMVRQAFVAQYAYSPELFDNWLQFIVEEERDRIIALLENYRESIVLQSAMSAGGHHALSDAIALIKGENE